MKNDLSDKMLGFDDKSFPATQPAKSPKVGTGIYGSTLGMLLVRNNSTTSNIAWWKGRVQTTLHV